MVTLKLGIGDQQRPQTTVDVKPDVSLSTDGGQLGDGVDASLSVAWGRGDDHGRVGIDGSTHPRTLR